MPLGDGQAISVGAIGGGKFLVSNGGAIVNRGVPTSLLVHPTPINSCESSFEENVLIQQADEQKIIYNCPQTIVENKIPNRKIIKLINTMGVGITEKTIYTTNSSIDLYLRQAVCQVQDINDTNKYIFNYLKLDGCRIKSPTIPVVIYMDNKIATRTTVQKRCVKPMKKQIVNSFLEKHVLVKSKDDDKEVINVGCTFVENRVLISTSKATAVTPATITVEDYKPPVTNAGSSAGGVKSFRIVAQKYSYFEYYMSFTDGTVIAIDGLPQGMVFEKAYLKGSPTTSGDFPITIKLDNKAVLSGLLTVTQVPRQL